MNLIGQTIGRYKIEEQLGEGGMATVYRALDTRLDRMVAIKFIRKEAFTTELLGQVLARFEREAKALARLTHPNIVNVHDYGEFEGAPYFVMQYVSGGTLRSRVGRPLPWTEAIRLILPVARALSYAHVQNIVHRDVKPSNILLTETGEPMLMDFGIAKILDLSSGATLTGAGTGIGTPEYMAPEQAVGNPVDGRADVYALAVVLYELVTGRTPYQADTPMAVMLKHITEPLPDPRQFVPALSPALAAILGRALQKQPLDRYADMNGFIHVLEGLLTGPETLPSPGMAAPEEIQDATSDSLALERKGDIGTALVQAQKMLNQARIAGQPEETAAALVIVARFHFRLQQYPAARSRAQEALALAAPDSAARADALLMLGMCAADTESLSEAEEYYRNAADLAYEIGEHLLRFRALHNLGTTVYLCRGQLDLALAASREALRLVREQHMDEWVSYPLMTMAWIYQYTGQVHQARQVLDEISRAACVAAVTQGYHPNTLALLALDEGDLEAAPPLFDQARAVAETTGDQGLGIEMRLGMSRYHRLGGNTAAALDWADDALTIARRTDKKQEQAQALIMRSRAAWDLGDRAAAEADLRTAAEIAIPLQAYFDLARAAFLLAALLHDQHHPEAREAWQEAARRIIRGGYAFLLEQERTLAFPLVAAYLNDSDGGTAELSNTLLSHLERVPPPPLHIFTLGRFEVRQGRRLIPEASWRQRRAGDLFRMLLISRGRTLSRDEVIETFWPEKSPGAANTSFHQATSVLRRALEPDLPEKFPSRYLAVEAGRISLRLPPGSWIDHEVFEQHCRTRTWSEAIPLYHGDLFPDDRYAGWAEISRQRLSQLFITAATALACDELAAGHPSTALDIAGRALETDPWQEKLVLLAMQASLAMNDRSGALRIYNNLMQTLQQDLGIVPSSELQKLYKSICDPC